jgi:uncharacterized membrane protein YqjE
MSSEQNLNSENPPDDRSLVRTILNIVATRSEMARLELAIARNNAVKTVVYGAVGAFFAVLSIIFVSIAVLAVFWEEHRIFAACVLAGFYVVLTLIFIGRARNLAANMPYAFTMTSQVLKEDLQSILAHPAEPRQAEENSAGDAADTPSRASSAEDLEARIRELQEKIDKGN